MKRETESLLITTQRNAIRTEAKIDNTLKDCDCRLSGGRYEIVDQIRSECSKLLLKKYKSKHNWVGGKGEPLGTMPEVKIWPYCQIIYAINWIFPKQWDE